MAFVQGSIDYSGVTCGTGTEVVFSLDGGVTWTTVAPTYAEIDAANDEVLVACRCIDDPTIVSINPTIVTITPADPTQCCVPTDPTGTPTVVDSNCNG